MRGRVVRTFERDRAIGLACEESAGLEYFDLIASFYCVLQSLLGFEVSY